MTYKNNNKTEGNPLLEKYDTPHNAIPYDRITLKDYIPAIKKAIRNEEKIVEEICNSNEVSTFDNTIAALDYSGVQLGNIIGAFNAVANASSNDEILAIEEEMQQLYVTHKNNITLNKKLFERIKNVHDSDQSHLSREQQRLLEQTYDSFMRNGANLKDNERDE